MIRLGVHRSESGAVRLVVGEPLNDTARREQAHILVCAAIELLVGDDTEPAARALECLQWAADALPAEDEASCKFCACTNHRPCELEDGPCHWHGAINGEFVCTNPKCLDKYEALLDSETTKGGTDGRSAD